MPSQQRLFNRNFLLFSQGIFVSLFGTNLHQVALALFIADYTDSPTFLSSVFMVMGIVSIFSSIYLANVTERYPRHQVMTICDLANGILAICFGIVIFFNRDHLIYPALFIMPVLQTVVASIYGPTLHAMVGDITSPALLSRANATISTLAQCAHLFGKGIAGWLYRIFGAPLLLIGDGVSYFFCSVCLWQIRTSGEESKEALVVDKAHMPGRENSWHEIAAGFRQISSIPCLSGLLGLQSAHLFFMTPVFILLPFFVKDERFLNCSADWYGYYFGAWGIGSVLGNWLCERNRSGKAQKIILACFLSVEGVAILYLSTLQIPEPGLLAFLSIGLTCGFSDNLIITTIQTTTPSSLRTRTFATAIAICRGSAPISTGLAGLLASMSGRRVDWIYSGCGVMILGLVGYLFYLGKNFDRLGQLGFALSETCCPAPTMVDNPQPKPGEYNESEK